MARLNVYVPDELAVRARAAGLNVSKLTQEAIETELQRRDLRAWMERVRASPPLEEIPREEHQRIMDEVRDEFGMRWDEVDDARGD
ncbi:type II toxin-antitoxin system CcdA family antitoxin [Nocardioides sp. BYT-33-1]|uniref:type II toxin-antitoxin system CcdA family antitoxin n=1 Tax=Nocardioides sp. BYT-33-1 TaxID=3416952 RepID=UPI003F5371BE